MKCPKKMSGSNSICLATVLLETGMIPMQEPATHPKLDTAGSTISVGAKCRGEKCQSVQTTNVSKLEEGTMAVVSSPEARAWIIGLHQCGSAPEVLSRKAAP